MSNNLNILSLNIRGGIKNINKRSQLQSLIDINKINIILLQETHVSSLSFKNEIDKIFECESFWSFGESDSRGVGILILKNFERDVKSYKRDNEGRIISVSMTIGSEDIKIISVYAPNQISDRKRFLTNDLDRFLIGTSPIIIGGDWNHVENLKKDKIGGNDARRHEGSIIMNKIKQTYNLTDCYRHIHKEETAYTWSCDSTNIKTRIDSIYISKIFEKSLRNPDIYTVV